MRRRPRLPSQEQLQLERQQMLAEVEQLYTEVEDRLHRPGSSLTPDQEEKLTTRLQRLQQELDQLRRLLS